MIFILFAVALGASAVGAVCGIGGGIIIKPVLDMIGAADIQTVSFLSGSTVLGMSTYSVIKNRWGSNKGTGLDWMRVTPIALGSALGGCFGKLIFDGLLNMFNGSSTVGAIQSGLLCLITLATIFYISNMAKIKTRNVAGPLAAFLIGMLLGVVCSFLGIGGGPINLVVLYYFFSMANAAAIQSSLYIICISQLMSLATSMATGSIPDFQPGWLAVMILGGIAGGMLGRRVGSLLDDRQTSRGLIVVMLWIVGICILNLCSI